MSAQAVTIPKAVRVIPAKPEYSGKSNSDFRPKRVAAYCRVSTDKEEQEHSFETQKEMYTDMIMMKPNWQMAGSMQMKESPERSPKNALTSCV